MEAIHKGSAQWRYLNSNSRERGGGGTPRTPRPKAVFLRPFSDTEESSPEWDSRCQSPTVEQAPFCSLDERLVMDEGQVSRQSASVASSAPESRSQSPTSPGVTNTTTYDDPSAVITSCLQAASRSLHALLVQPSEVAAMDSGPLQHLPSVITVLRHSLANRTRGVLLLRRTLGSSLAIAAALQILALLQPPTSSSSSGGRGGGIGLKIITVCQFIPAGVVAVMGLLHTVSLSFLLSAPAPQKQQQHQHQTSTTSTFGDSGPGISCSTIPSPTPDHKPLPLYGMSCLTVVLVKVAVSCITETFLSEGRVSSTTAALMYLRQRTLLEALYTFIREVGGASIPATSQGKYIPTDRQQMVESITNAGGAVQSLLWFHSCRARPLSISASSHLTSGRPWLVEQLRFVASSFWLRRHRAAIVTLHDQLRSHFIIDSKSASSPSSTASVGGGNVNKYRELFLHTQRACGILFTLQAQTASDASGGAGNVAEVQRDLHDAMERLSNSWYRHLTTTITPHTASSSHPIDYDDEGNAGNGEDSGVPVGDDGGGGVPRTTDVLDQTAQGVHPIPLFPKDKMDADEGAERGALPADFMAQLRRAAASRNDGAVVADGDDDDE